MNHHFIVPSFYLVQIHECRPQTRRLRDLAISGGWEVCLSAIAIRVRDSCHLQQGLQLLGWYAISFGRPCASWENICSCRWENGQWGALEVGSTASLTLVAELKAIDCFVSRRKSERGVGSTAKTVWREQAVGALLALRYRVYQ